MTGLGFDADDYRNGACPACEGPLNDDGDCEACEPRVDLEASPVRATFIVDTATGAVTWGWSCTDAAYEAVKAAREARS